MLHRRAHRKIRIGDQFQPFHRLPALHEAIVAKAGAEPPTMGYFAFQKEVWRKLWRGRERQDYADGSVWID